MFDQTNSLTLIAVGHGAFSPVTIAVLHCEQLSHVSPFPLDFLFQCPQVLLSCLAVLAETAKPTSMFSWVPMPEARYWQWGDWSIVNLNEVIYFMSTIGCTPEAPIPWLVVEVVGNSNGWFRFTEKRVPTGQMVNIAWEVNDIDDNQQPFEKPPCAASVKFDAPYLPCGLYGSGIPQYTWDILVRPRQLFVISADGILEFRKHAMGFLYSDKTGSLLFPRPGKTSASSLSTWLMSQPAEDGVGIDGDSDEDDGLAMEW